MSVMASPVTEKERQSCFIFHGSFVVTHVITFFLPCRLLSVFSVQTKSKYFVSQLMLL